jgi:hypothetical protein
MEIPRKWRNQLYITLFIAVSLPVSIFLLDNFRPFGTKASPGNAILTFNPLSQTNNVGETATYGIIIAPNTEKVTGVELYISYDPAVIEVTDITPGPFFTDPAATVGQPLEIKKSIQNGIVQYVLAFPLGSNFNSTETKTAAYIKYSAKSNGTSNFTFLSATPNVTLVSDINALNVLSSTAGGIVNVTSGARLFFSSPRPDNPQIVNSTFDIDVMADTAGQSIDGVDALITFDKSALQVISVTKGEIPGLSSYPQKVFDNSAGTVAISANSGSGGSATVNGSNLTIGTIKFKPIAQSTAALINFDFAAGNRNDSNLVLSGTAQTSDPVDILSSVTNSNITIQNQTITATPIPTLSPTPIPTVTPLPTNSPTPLNTATPNPSATMTPMPTNSPTPILTATSTPMPTNTVTLTPTPLIAKSVLFKFGFQGLTRPGINRSKQITVMYKRPGETASTTLNLTTNTEGQTTLSLLPGNYLMLIKSPGRLAKRFGSQLNPVVISSTTTGLDFSASPLIGGDLNNDGVVNEIDYTSLFLSSFRSHNATIDLDGSGEVNNLDFGIMRSSWGLLSDTF